MKQDDEHQFIETHGDMVMYGSSVQHMMLLLLLLTVRFHRVPTRHLTLPTYPNLILPHLCISSEIQ